MTTPSEDSRTRTEETPERDQPIDDRSQPQTQTDEEAAGRDETAAREEDAATAKRSPYRLALWVLLGALAAIVAVVWLFLALDDAPTAAEDSRSAQEAPAGDAGFEQAARDIQDSVARLQERMSEAGDQVSQAIRDAWAGVSQQLAELVDAIRTEGAEGADATGQRLDDLEAELDELARAMEESTEMDEELSRRIEELIAQLRELIDRARST